MGLGDTASVNEMMEGSNVSWNGTSNVLLERCMSCMSKLGALSRSSTAVLTPGAKPFSPAWTMEEVDESNSDELGRLNRDRDQSAIVKNNEQICSCQIIEPPERPPKSNKLNLKLNIKPPLPLPIRSFSHSQLSSIQENLSKVGPYENYDVPKIPSAEGDGEYYDTPRRLKECLNSDLFKMTKSSTTNTIVLKKPCGCLLKFGKKPRQPMIVDTDESFEQSNCPCQKVSDWANNWIRLPYCNKNAENKDNSKSNKENKIPIAVEKNALYATIDLSRKTRGKSHQKYYTSSSENFNRSLDSQSTEIDDGPLANYENLNFALSLEHYENAKDLLKKAGVTQMELDALSATLNPVLAFKTLNKDTTCLKCGHPQEKSKNRSHHSGLDEYLLMEPKSRENNKLNLESSTLSGYTPMSPIGGFAIQTLKTPAKIAISRLLDEKSASNPTLCGSQANLSSPGDTDIRVAHERAEYRKRSSSADSSRFLEDVKEFEGSIGSRGSSSSIETLRDSGPLTMATCDCQNGKHSDADSSEASKTIGNSATAGGNRDSSSSNDSGVSSWSLRGEGAPGPAHFELPATTAAARRRYRTARRAAASPHGAPHRRARSSTAGRSPPPDTHKCCSAEAEVPLLSPRPPPVQEVRITKLRPDMGQTSSAVDTSEVFHDGVTTLRGVTTGSYWLIPSNSASYINQ
ncbi:uncharacterized protein LOC126973845 [Leptidea sinapis]|uniref:uncharacterized protein LOC126973845 n=1 Tax=Leptidea sinapis TaxID=189913 RepID=UPI0021C38915|nr:uncharacterized protein LOC126973845 [Leptidea sinapis]